MNRKLIELLFASAFFTLLADDGIVGYEGEAKLTFSFTQPTGIWKGTYLMWPDSSPSKSVKVSFEGILVPGEEDLKGFGTYDATSSYPTYDRTGKKTGEKSYKYKESVPVDFIDGHKFL